MSARYFTLIRSVGRLGWTARAPGGPWPAPAFAPAESCVAAAGVLSMDMLSTLPPGAMSAE